MNDLPQHNYNAYMLGCFFIIIKNSREWDNKHLDPGLLFGARFRINIRI
jgi:hypothetical protein